MSTTRKLTKKQMFTASVLAGLFTLLALLWLYTGTAEAPISPGDAYVEVAP